MVWVKNVRAAARLILSNQVRYISFDNDLGPNSAEGRKLARRVERWAFNGEIEEFGWSVHTANPVAYKEIVASLMNASKYWRDRENL